MGMVASQLGQAEEAKTNFKSAIGADPNAKLPASGVTPAIKSQFDEASGAGAAAGKGEGDDEVPAPGGGVAGAIKLIQEALKADQEGRLEECITKDKAAL